MDPTTDEFQGSPRQRICLAKIGRDTPPSRRAFATDSEELHYLYKKILYWYYGRGSKTHAGRFVRRYRHLVRKMLGSHRKIHEETCWSLYCELAGDLASAIRYRQSEIRLIRRLWLVSRRADARGKAAAFAAFGPRDLSDRLALLGLLRWENGDRAGALMALREARRVCGEHQIQFLDAILLDQIRHESSPKRQKE